MTEPSSPQQSTSAPKPQPEIVPGKELRRLRTAVLELTKSVQEASAGRKPSRRTLVALSMGAFALLALEALDVVEDVKLLSHSLAKWIGPTQVELSGAQIQSLTGRGAEARLSDGQVELLARRVASVLSDRLEGQLLVDRPLAAHGDGAVVPDHGFKPIAWVQLGGDGDWIVRAIFAERWNCPQIKVEGSSYQMQERRTFADGFYPVLVCEFLVHAGEQASIEGVGNLPIPTQEIHAILLIGDTGCRLTHYAWQGCADPKDWPFRTLLADALAQFERLPKGSRQSSKLIIHVGDYHYREKPCPRHRPRCGTSPSGDTWEAWYADFFDPARDALLIAPWVMLRGNHEDCERAGAGWHHFFGPTTSERAAREACREYTSPIQLKIDGGPMLLALDTASGEKKLYGEDRDTYARWRESLSAIVSRRGSEDWLWILAHQPLRTLPRSNTAGTTKACNAEEHPCPKEEIQAALAKFDERARKRSVVISGDTHMFQFIHGPKEFPVTQIIAGMSGTALDRTSDFQGTWTADGRMHAPATNGSPYYAALARFGYVLMSRSPNGSWEAKVRALGAGGSVEDAFTCILGGSEKAVSSGCESPDPKSVATSQP